MNFNTKNSSLENYYKHEFPPVLLKNVYRFIHTGEGNFKKKNALRDGWLYL